MSELTGKQLETFRLALQSAFGAPAQLEMFLRERLDRRYSYYVADRDDLQIACFRLLTSSEAEGWLDEFVRQAVLARPSNSALIGVARQLGIAVAAVPRDTAEPDEPPAAEPPLWRSFNPYRGLLALREQDSDFLFGRDDDIDSFIDTMATEQSRIFLALGASGVGKSSLIFAGVLGALNRCALKSRKPWPIALERSQTWPHLVFMPGAEPVYSLASAFLRQWSDETSAAFRTEAAGWRKLLVDGDALDGLVQAADAARKRKNEDPPSRYLVYVDQGEELYTRGGREPGRDGASIETQRQKEARRFSELLAEAAAHPRLIVLMSARSDFLGQLQADKTAGPADRAKLFDVHRKLDITPLSEEGLRQVITRPAERLGVSFDNGLDKALVAATRAEIGGLPLLSYALETLWQEMQARQDGASVLAWSAPEGDGIDLAKKLAERADAFVQRYAAQQHIVRRLFCVHLAHVPVQGDPTRKRAILDTLSADERDLVQALTDREQRILVTGEAAGRATAEVAHEKLFTAWATLRSWIESKRGFYAWRTQVAADAGDWVKSGRQSKDLLTGRPLERAHSFLETDAEDIPEEDKAFIRASAESDDRRRKAEEDREREQQASKLEAARRLAQRTMAGLVVAAILAAIAVGAGWYASSQASKANAARNDTLRIQTRLLTNSSNAATDEGNPGLGASLALEALPDRKSPDQTARERVLWPPAEVALEKARRALREQRTLSGHEGSVTSVAVTPDGSRIVTGSDDKTARIWEAASGRELAQLKGHEGIVSSVAITPDGSRIVTGSYDKTARIWDAASGRELAQLKGHEGTVNSVAVTPYGSRVVTGSEDKTARIWDAASGRELAQLKCHEDSVSSVAVTPDGSRIVTGSGDKTARIWDASSGRELAQFKGHEDAVLSVAVTPDGSRIVTGSSDKMARIWDAADGRELAQLKGHEGGVSSVAVAPDGSRIVTASDDKTARIWDAADRRELAQFKGHDDAVLSVAVTSDGSRIVTASRDKTARIWDAVTRRELAQLKGHKDAVLSVAVTPDGSRIVTGSFDKTARIWDAASGRELAQLKGHEDAVFSVAVTPDGSRIVTGSGDTTARIWNAADGRELAQLNGHTSSIWSVAVTPDGSRIVTGSSDNTARIWDAASGRELARLKGGEDAVLSVAVTPDGSRIVTGSGDKTARIWDAADGREAAQLKGHEGSVLSVAVTPDGSRVVTGSEDKTARIWDAATGRELAQLRGHEGEVRGVLVTPDGARIITSSGDKTARTWPLSPFGQQLIDETKKGAPRCLAATQREQYSLPPEPPLWCYEMSKWPYDPATLMIDGKALLAQKNLEAARAKFATARKYDPSLGPRIDALLAAKTQERP